MLNCHFRRWWGNKGVMKQRAKRVPGAPTPRETSPILTSVAFFSASSSFSWASLRASENLSNSSSVPFNFFCRATKSSSSWGAFQCAGSLRGGRRERAQAHRSDRGRERRRGRKRGRDRKKESGDRGVRREEGKREERKLGEPASFSDTLVATSSAVSSFSSAVWNSSVTLSLSSSVTRNFFSNSLNSSSNYTPI